MKVGQRGEKTEGHIREDGGYKGRRLAIILEATCGWRWEGLTEWGRGEQERTRAEEEESGRGEEKESRRAREKERSAMGCRSVAGALGRTMGCELTCSPVTICSNTTCAAPRNNACLFIDERPCYRREGRRWPLFIHVRGTQLQLQ